MSISLTPLPDDEVDRLYRLETLAKEFKAAYEWNCSGYVEWEDQVNAAQKALFEELEK